MWIAKGVLTNNTYSSEYLSIYDCQCFIDNDLKEYIKNELIEFIKFFDLQRKLEKYYNYKSTIDLDNEQHYKYVLDLFCLLCGNEPIKCYNIEQNRFCTCLDF